VNIVHKIAIKTAVLDFLHPCDVKGNECSLKLTNVHRNSSDPVTASQELTTAKYY
jgi:hypothetical protein